MLGKRLDALLKEALDILAADGPLPARYVTIRWPANGTITGIAKSGRI